MKVFLRRLAECLLGAKRAEVLAFWQAYRRGRLTQNAYYNELTVLAIARAVTPGTVCLDVGAHRGTVLREMQRVAPQARIHAFEPLPEQAAFLRVKYAGPQVVVHNLALGDAAGTAEFHHVVTNPGYSGLRRRQFDREHEEVQVIRVETARMDERVPAEEHVSFIKVDVEGAELQVFQGGAGTIRRCRPVIVFEHGKGSADVYGTTPETVFDLLSGELGLKLSLLDRWLFGWGALSRRQFVREYRAHRNYYFVAYP